MTLIFIHEAENNDASQTHLETNRERFTKAAQRVYDLLNSGVRLTVMGAMNEYGIMSLPRRCKDLKENGIDIKDRWLRDSNGRCSVKEYYLEKE